uniref:TFIIS-type domain-containing protein n=1 Tax=Ditylenchus dipsaci TaxID=166011 RepID=A0A915DT49_9BILA
MRISVRNAVRSYQYLLCSSHIQCVLCKSEWPIQAREDRLVSRQERSYVKTVADAEESLLAKQDEVVQVEHICQKCGYNLASYTTQQTRSADEDKLFSTRVSSAKIGA